MLVLLVKRISPFDNELGVFANKVLLGEDEEGPGHGPTDPWKTQVRRPLGRVAQRRVAARRRARAPTHRVVSGSVRGETGHPIGGKTKWRERRSVVCVTCGALLQGVKGEWYWYHLVG